MEEEKKVRFAIPNRTQNIAGVWFPRYGEVGGSRFLFTHRNPKTGSLWSDEINFTKHENGKTYTVRGGWVTAEKVTLI